MGSSRGSAEPGLLCTPPGGHTRDTASVTNFWLYLLGATGYQSQRDIKGTKQKSVEGGFDTRFCQQNTQSSHLPCWVFPQDRLPRWEQYDTLHLCTETLGAPHLLCSSHRVGVALDQLTRRDRFGIGRTGDLKQRGDQAVNTTMI